MLEFVQFYIVIGFLINLISGLWIFYRGKDDGYFLVPEPMIFFLTIFSWPKTLWDMIANTGKDDDNGN